MKFYVKERDRYFLSLNIPLPKKPAKKILALISNI